jgi:E3 ubiquitin-protein ligase TRIP12
MQLTNEPAEKLAKHLVKTSNGAFELCGFASGGKDTHVYDKYPVHRYQSVVGSEAMESVIKLATQYYGEIGQHKRKNFIARQLSFHGNTLSTLSLAYHPTRRAPYIHQLNTSSFHHVSPAYAKRFQLSDESEADYVERLRKELEDKFIALGPDTVIACP